MLSALHLVLSGGRYLPPQLLNAMPAPQPPRLSSRQQEILHMLAAGKTNKCICAELGLAERTVKAHITEVLRILGVHSRTQAALVAVRMGLDQTPPPPSP
jgi:DNA-binding NarL/FixJ family response regulator